MTRSAASRETATRETLRAIPNCGRCADLIAAGLLGADVYDVLLEHQRNHEAGRSLWPEVNEAAARPFSSVSAVRRDSDRATPSTRLDSECPKCGSYMPLTLNGESRVHECHRTPPIGDLPYSLCACPSCGGYAPFRAGCWGTPDDPHDHVYMIPIHELVVVRRDSET